MNTTRPVITCLRTVLVLSCVLGLCCPQVRAQVRPAARLVQEALEAAERVSGRALGPAAREAAEAQLRRAALRYGDDVIRAARTGGLELPEAAARWGDDVWTLSVRVPQGSRALALRPAELLPLARRIGPEVLELEAKAPRLTTRVAELFGDDAVRYLATVPAADATRLAGYAARADSPATRVLLLDGYRRGGAAFIERLDWKIVMAGGLSAAVVTGAYKTSDGLQNALRDMARRDPGGFGDMLTRLARPVTWPLGLLGFGAVAVLLRRLWLWHRRVEAKACARRPAQEGPPR
jgi:hypothetical protein